MDYHFETADEFEIVGREYEAEKAKKNHVNKRREKLPWKLNVFTKIFVMEGE